MLVKVFGDYIKKIAEEENSCLLFEEGFSFLRTKTCTGKTILGQGNNNSSFTHTDERISPAQFFLLVFLMKKYSNEKIYWLYKYVSMITPMFYKKKWSQYHTNVDLIFILTVLNLQKLPMLMSDLIKINIKLVFWSGQSSTNCHHQGTYLMQFLF